MLRVFRYGAALAFFPVAGHAQVLEEMISSALLSHPAAQARRALEDTARAGVDSARWQFYPTPSIAVETSRTSATDLGYQGDSRVSTLRLQQPLWAGGRLTAGMDKAEAEASLSHASLEEVRLQLALRVVQAYGDWMGARLKTHAYEKSQAAHERLHTQVRRRIEQGASAESDLVLAVSRLKSVAADLSVARAQMDIALARLGLLLGRTVDASELAGPVAPQPVKSGVQELIALAVAVDPTIKKAKAQAGVQEAVIAERRADLSPEIYLRAERQFGNYLYGNVPPESRLFVGLNSRFGAGFSSMSNVEGARSQYQAALAEVEVQTFAVSEQVQSDYASATYAEARKEALSLSLEAAGRVSESFDRQFLAGRKTWLDVMNAARELAQTEVQLAEIESTQVVVSWRLAVYSQGVDAVVGSKQ